MAAGRIARASNDIRSHARPIPLHRCTKSPPRMNIPAGFIVAVGLIIIFGAGVLAAWLTREK